MREYLNTMPTNDVFAIFERVDYSEGKAVVDIDYFKTMFTKYEVNNADAKVDFILIVNDTQESKDTFTSIVIAAGSNKSSNAIIALQKEFPSALIIGDSFSIKPIFEFYGLKSTEELNEKKLILENTAEIALWLLLLLIFGPIVIVIFIVLACFKWICRGSYHSAPLLI
jgi:hypothetical protein